MAHAVTIKRLSKTSKNFRYPKSFYKVPPPRLFMPLKFPEPPKKKGLREIIEKCAMDNYGFPVYWYSEIKTNFAHKH